MGTREKILEEALTLFSQKGYNGVSVREIAGAIGIKESSLYNHFANKQEIFDQTVESVSYTHLFTETYTGRLLSALWGNAYSSSSLPLLILFSQF